MEPDGVHERIEEALTDKPLAVLVASFAAAELAYTPWQIATFYTALQTKGFVILSGISGTGKTKLAQHFAAILQGFDREDPESFADDEATRHGPTGSAMNVEGDLSDSHTEQITFRVSYSMIKGKYVPIRSRFHRYFDDLAAGDTQSLPIEIDGRQEAGTIKKLWFDDPARSDEIRLRLHPPHSTWLAGLSVGDQIVLQLKTDENRHPKLLRLSIAQTPHLHERPTEVDISSVATPERHDDVLRSRGETNRQFIAVRSDWRDRARACSATTTR